MLETQRDLYRLMSEVAATTENVNQFHFDPRRVDWLEEQIDALSKTVEMPKEFIVPGAAAAGAALSLARTIVRRAERRAASSQIGCPGSAGTSFGSLSRRAL